jgi:hypothetical protein
MSAWLGFIILIEELSAAFRSFEFGCIELFADIE